MASSHTTRGRNFTIPLLYFDDFTPCSDVTVAIPTTRLHFKFLVTVTDALSRLNIKRKLGNYYNAGFYSQESA
jgi:hypothetical protein